jgi:hypothetical protein
MYVGFSLIFLSAICKMLNNTAVSNYFTLGLAHHIYLSMGLTLMSLFYVLTALPANLDVSAKANYMFKVFCLSMSLLLTGLVFKWNLWPFGDGFLITSFFSLFVYYVIKAFTQNAQSLLESIYNKMFFLGFAILTMSFLFRIQGYPGCEEMIAVSYFAMMVVVFLQLRMLIINGTWLVNINKPVGFSILILFVLLCLIRLDSVIQMLH